MRQSGGEVGPGRIGAGWGGQWSRGVMEPQMGQAGGRWSGGAMGPGRDGAGSPL